VLLSQDGNKKQRSVFARVPLLHTPENTFKNTPSQTLLEYFELRDHYKLQVGTPVKNSLTLGGSFLWRAVHSPV